jgi:uncharacterized Zn finger protein
MTETGNPMSETSCLRCGRKLTSAASVAAGYGRSCAAKVRAAARALVLSTFKSGVLEKAEQLITDGGIVRIAHRGTPAFRVVASNGVDRYTTAASGCTCPAGLAGRHMCYHRVAARLLVLAA